MPHEADEFNDWPNDGAQVVEQDNWRASSFAKSGVTITNAIAGYQAGQWGSDFYVVERLVAEAAVTVLFGPSGCGKTHLAVDLAVRVAADMRFLGENVGGGSVIYVAAEDFRGVRRRLTARALAAGVTELPIAVVSEIDLLKSGEARRFATWVTSFANSEEGREPSMIIFDTLTCAMSGNQDNGADAAALMQALHEIARKTGAGVLVLHHSGLNDTHRPRGSSVISDRADLLVRLRSNGTIGTGGTIEAKVVKARNDTANSVVTMTSEMKAVGPQADDGFVEQLRAVVLTGERIVGPQISDDHPVEPETRKSDRRIDRVRDLIAEMQAATFEELLTAADTAGIFGSIKPDSRRRTLLRYIDDLTEQKLIWRDGDRLGSMSGHVSGHCPDMSGEAVRTSDTDTPLPEREGVRSVVRRLDFDRPAGSQKAKSKG